jgi:hypothetical protein
MYFGRVVYDRLGPAVKKTRDDGTLAKLGSSAVVMGDG